MSLGEIGDRALLEAARCWRGVAHTVPRVPPAVSCIVTGMASGLLFYEAACFGESDTQAPSMVFGRSTLCVLGGAIFLSIFYAYKRVIRLYATDDRNRQIGKPGELKSEDFGLSDERQRQEKKACQEHLKHHRFRGLEAENNYSIVSCDEATTKKLRRTFHSSLFTADAVSKLTQRAHDRAVECAEVWTAGTKAQGDVCPDEGYRRFLRRVAIESICNLPQGDVIDADLMEELDTLVASIFSGATKPASGWNEFMNLVGKIEGSFVHTMNTDKLPALTVMGMVRISFEATLSNTSELINKVIEQCAKNPGITKTARREIAAKVAGGETLPNAIRNSTEIRKILHEALRLSTPVPIALRFGQETDRIHIGKLAKYPALVGNNPGEFRPDRFEHEVQGGSPKFWPGLSFLPFGSGTHVCPGWKLSAEAATQLLGVLLYSYEFSQDPNSVNDAIAVRRATESWSSRVWTACF